MRADKVMVYLIAFLILLVWGLLYLNKGSEKIFTAILVILTTTLATGLGSLLVILRPETRTEEFTSVFIHDSEQDVPLLVGSYPIRKRLGLQSSVWADAHKPPGEKQSDQESGIAKVDTNEKMLDFLIRSIIDKMAERFHQHWSVEAKAWSLPGSNVSTWGLSKDAAKLPKFEQPKGDLLRLLGEQGNVFSKAQFEDGGMFGKICFPPGTTCVYRRGNGESELLFKNPFVQLSIKANFSSMGVIPGGFFDVFEIDKEGKNRYREVSFRVVVHAEYSSWRAGWEMMTHQKRWIESVIALLKETFDWSQIAQEVKGAWEIEQLKKIDSRPAKSCP